jgi:hypothetical protein
MTAEHVENKEVESRKEFEAWHKKEWPEISTEWFAQENRYYYGNGQQDKWESWQASRAALHEELTLNKLAKDALRVQLEKAEQELDQLRAEIERLRE